MDIKSLSVDEIIMLHELVRVARNAKTDSERIQKKYCKSFGNDEKNVVIWSSHDDNNYYFLTNDLVWHAQYQNKNCDIECTSAGIYKYYLAEYLVNSGYAQRTTKNGDITEEGKMANAVVHFRSAFLSKIPPLFEGESHVSFFE